ncbi:MAG: hypothetical protein EOO67_07175, partial [Microbacterium sp.]
MSTAGLTRSWPPLAAWGAGLIQLALGAGILTGTGAAPRAAGILLLVVVGAASLIWGALRFTGRPLDRTGLGVALAGVIAAGTALLADPVRSSVAAVAVAIALDMVVVGATIGRSRRPRTRRAPSPRAVVAGVPPFAGFVLAAVVVAGVVTPALASTEAGRLAPDHGS